MSDYDYLQNRRNMIVGAFVIVGVLVFAYMVFLFGELPVAVTELTSFTVEAKFLYAPGVQETTPVRYCGYQIGKVIKVEPPTLFVNDKGQSVPEVVVKMAIDRKYKIPSNIKARLGKRGMGSSYLDLIPQPLTPQELENLKPKYLTNGLTLETIQTGGESDLIPSDMQDKINTFFVKAAGLMDNLNVVVGDANNQQNLKRSLANLSKATEESISTLQEIREFSQVGKEKLTTVSDSITQTSEELGETLIELRRTISKINSGQGTIGKLVNDEQLYNNLVDSTEELKIAIEKMKKTFQKTSEKGIKVSVF